VLAEILTSAASWHNEQPLLTYLVPAELEAEMRLGQLVAVPYGERLVEGIVWKILEDDTEGETDSRSDLRPIRTILDPEPALLPHQRALAEWIAEYYVTSLAQVAVMMLPPGLMQRSRVVLQLVKNELGEVNDGKKNSPGMPLQVQALVGLLLEERELDVERLKEMLGPTKAKAILQEALASGSIEREPQLQAPQAKPRRQAVVRLIAQGEALEAWRQRTETRLRESLPEPSPTSMAPDNVRRRPKAKKGMPDPWALPEVASTLMLTPKNKVGLLAQHQLAAVDLLLYSRNESHGNRISGYWTPAKLCKASGLSKAELETLVQEGIIAIGDIEVQRDPLQDRVIPGTKPLSLTSDQKKALDEILSGLIPTSLAPIENMPPTPSPLAPTRGATTMPTPSDSSVHSSGTPCGCQGAGGHDPDQTHHSHPKPILLHGVTGSGKTEVYLQALAAIIGRGKRGIVLVPEIALTAQTVQRFAGRFPGRVAIIHSALSNGERYDEWRRIRAGKVDVVVGSRSALFSPVPDLGILILDEEHDPAYKQDERRPTYHAREAALALGRILNIPVVLGSATPAVETFYRTERGRYRLVELPGRIGADLPPVEIVDLRSELHAGNTSIFSRRLQSELERVLNTGQQAILYLNRRGAASCILCRECGYVAMCDRCDIPLTYHSTERILLCHYCNWRTKVLLVCPLCNKQSMRYFGLGTEKVQNSIARLFPSARVLRWDRDTAKNRRAHEQLLDRFANREADIMIGTQMIAKGLDLPGVTLVGVVSADIALTLPDFSAAERSFTLLTQVAGRAGRGEEAGRVIMQTFNPLHFCIDAASRHDFHEFYNAEIEVRRRYGYPPFRQFVKFTYSHQNRHRAQNEALLLHEQLTDWIERLGLAGTDIVGPAPALMERIDEKFRWQLIVRGPDVHPLLRVVEAPGWYVDIDPVSIL